MGAASDARDIPAWLGCTLHAEQLQSSDRSSQTLVLGRIASGAQLSGTQLWMLIWGVLPQQHKIYLQVPLN